MEYPTDLVKQYKEVQRSLSAYKDNVRLSEIYTHPEINARCTHIFVDSLPFVEVNLDALQSLQQIQKANWLHFLKKRIKEAIHE